jgi:hypothetical protein
MPASAEQGAAPFVPDDQTLPVLQEAVQHCRGCISIKMRRRRFSENWRPELKQRSQRLQS